MITAYLAVQRREGRALIGLVVALVVVCLPALRTSAHDLWDLDDAFPTATTYAYDALLSPAAIWGHAYDAASSVQRSSGRGISRDLQDKSVLARARTPALAFPGLVATRGTPSLTDEAASVFTRSGGLQDDVIALSREIIPGFKLGNPSVIKVLTSDGSDIAQWGKYVTPTFRSPSGPFQVHFYRNRVTGAVNYTWDYKSVFGGR